MTGIRGILKGGIEKWASTHFSIPPYNNEDFRFDLSAVLPNK